MATRKRGNPDGVVGLIAGAISDQQSARAQTQRLEARAQQAWAKEDAKVAAWPKENRRRPKTESTPQHALTPPEPPSHQDKLPLVTPGRHR